MKNSLGLMLAAIMGIAICQEVGADYKVTLADNAHKEFEGKISQVWLGEHQPSDFFHLSLPSANRNDFDGRRGNWLALKLTIDGIQGLYLGHMKHDEDGELSCQEWEHAFHYGKEGDDKAIVFRVTKEDPKIDEMLITIPDDAITITDKSKETSFFCLLRSGVKPGCYRLSNSSIRFYNTGWWHLLNLTIDGVAGHYLGYWKIKGTHVPSAQEWINAFTAGKDGNKNAVVFKIAQEPRYMQRYVYENPR